MSTPGRGNIGLNNTEFKHVVIMFSLDNLVPGDFPVRGQCLPSPNPHQEGACLVGKEGILELDPPHPLCELEMDHLFCSLDIPSGV